MPTLRHGGVHAHHVQLPAVSGTGNVEYLGSYGRCQDGLEGRLLPALPGSSSGGYGLHLSLDKRRNIGHICAHPAGLQGGPDREWA